jgi:hypothetical protein
MDNKQFRQHLARLVDFVDVHPKIQREGPGQYDEVHDIVYDGEPIRLERAFNPTLGVQLVQLKPREALCELGCGLIINRQVTHHILSQNPEPHWRTKCATCHRYQHPSGTGFLKSNSGVTVANEFSAYFREQRHLLKTSANSKPRE